jgi:MFS family permease
VKATGKNTRGTGALGGLWRRELVNYPDAPTRAAYLAIVVLATAVLYYELYVAGAVSPSIIVGYGMTFPFYVYITVAANVAGALGSLAAGLADRWGRANLIAYGLLATGALTLFGIPNASGEWEFAVVFAAIGYIEGIVLVATPALVRDFTQQLGRASAMGLWTLGPVVGSLVVAVVASVTLGRLHPWRDQFVICGLVGLAVGLVAVGWLRELSPRLRDQLKASLRDRALIEARARGVDLDESLRRPWRQVLRPDVIGPGLGIAAFLLIYFTAVGFFTLYFTTLRGFSLPAANSLGIWFWASTAVAVIVVGVVSDVVRVRKPFMVAGAAGAIVLTVVFSRLAAGTSFGTFAVVISVLAVFLAIAFVPWLASFTETVEKRNPELTAAGLAVCGWIVRVVIAVAVLMLPVVVSSLTPLLTRQVPGATAAAGDAAVGAAAAVVPGQLRDWLWLCVAGEVIFLPSIFLLTGFWSPRKAREDAEAIECLVQLEADALREP